MSKGPANSGLLVKAARLYAARVGVSAPSEERIQHIIEKVLVERGAMESVERGLMTRDEAVLLFLAHLHSAFFMGHAVVPKPEPWSDPGVVRMVKLGLFGP